MTFVAPESAPLNAARIPSIVVLGADALLAALPATPVQLAHACVLAGYQSVIPVSWGDELIAAASLRALQQHGQLPAIQCSCPHVAHRLLAVGTDLRPFLVSLVAPPVVLARYLRAAHTPAKLRITYVGRCPGAADESIDARLTPEELLAMFADRQIVLDDQPRVFDSVIPPDRRRYRSQPGGLPTPEMLWALNEDGATGARSLVELYGDELPVELAQHLLAGKPVLIDVAPKLGCVCSGAAPGVDAAEARARVIAIEPPRAASPVIDERLSVDATLALPASPRSAIDIVSPPSSTSPGTHVEELSAPDDRVRPSRHEELAGHQPAASVDLGSSAPAPTQRRISPARGVTRHAGGTLPTARDAGGRQLPRTYVARRRSPSRLARSASAGSVPDSHRETAGDTVLAEEPALPNGAPAPAAGDASLAAVSLDIDATRIDVSTIASTATGAEVMRPPGTPTPEPTASARSSGTESPERTESSPPPRYAERAVALPVTPRSDAPLRDEAAPHGTTERPVMQLLTLGLLISMIVLVSAAVGVLVGRWMTQR